MRWREQPQAFPALRNELDCWHRMPDQANLRLYVSRDYVLQDLYR